MTKWLLAVLVTVLVVKLALPRLGALLRVGRLPGDVRWRVAGRRYYLPFGTALLGSALATLIWRYL